MKNTNTKNLDTKNNKVKIRFYKKKSFWLFSVIIFLTVSMIPTSIYSARYCKIKSDYELLLEDYEQILENYELYRNVVDEGFFEYVKNMPIPIKMLFFYDYARATYLEQFGLMDFMLALILHDVGLYNHFEDLSRELEQIWITNNSMKEADLAMQKLYWWDVYWRNPNGSRYLFHTYVEQQVDYVYDDVFTEHTNQTGDYCKAAIETALTFQGDCEDQSILCSTLLKAAGYDVILGTIYDPNYNDDGIDEFAHAFLWVKVNPLVNDGWTSYLWRFGDAIYEWLLLDPTNYSYGENPEWIEHYDILGYNNWSDYMNWRVIAQPGDTSLNLNSEQPSHE